MTYEEMIKMELEHFIKEKEDVKKEMSKSENEIKSMECRQRLIMINEIIQIKEERLNKLKKND